MTDAPTSPKNLARLPRGFADRSGADIAAAEAMIAKVREVYKLYGFEAVETPFVEYTDALGKFLPDLDRPNEGVFSFQDDDEQWLSLRYDLTAPLARHVAENFDKLPKPYRSMRSGWVFRNEKPGPGRFRQFMQLDADTVGSSSPAADAEMCMMAADSLRALGFKDGEYVIKVNNRKVLDGVLESVGLGGDANAGRRLIVLRALDKFDRLGAKGVSELLGAGRTDGSGDFTKGAGLSNDGIVRLLEYLQPKFPNDILVNKNGRRIHEQSDEVSAVDENEIVGEEGGNTSTINSLSGLFDSSLFLDGLAELRQIASLTESAGYPQSTICIDPSVVRGLEYYTGPVFEAELFIKDAKGKPLSFGSVGGGGRYDGLVSRFRGEPVPATGFSIGVSRLLAALRAINSPILASSEEPGPVVVAVLDRDNLADYQLLVTTLRQAGIAAEMYLGASGLNAQLKYADKRNSRCAIIQGSNERDAPGAPQVVVRDLALGAEIAKMNKDRADYLDLRAKAQMTVPVAHMVARVREVLAR